MPALVASVNPSSFSLSSVSTVLCVTGHLVATPDDVAELLLARGLVEKAELLSGQISLKMTRPAVVSMNLRFGIAVNVSVGRNPGFCKRMRSCVDHCAFSHREFHFGRIGKQRKLAFPSFHAARILREVITAQRDVLRRRRDRLAAGRRKDVVRREHEHARFHLRFDRKRHVHRHLVAVEVRVVGQPNERMNANRFAFDQERFESLNRKTMQGRRAVQQHRMTSVTSSRISQTSGVWRSIIFFRTAHGVHVAEILQAANDERLEQNQRHFLGKPH